VFWSGLGTTVTVVKIYMYAGIILTRCFAAFHYFLYQSVEHNVRDDRPRTLAVVRKTHSVSPDASRCCLRLATAREDSKVASGANRVNRLLFLVWYRFCLEPTNSRGFDCSCGRPKPSRVLDYPMAEFHPLRNTSFVYQLFLTYRQP
jgi:hypothetical protein